MTNKTDYREATVCRNDLCTCVGLVAGFDDDVRSNMQHKMQCLFALRRFLV